MMSRPGLAPYIHVQGETTVPSSICLFSVTGGKWNLIEVPQPVLDLPLEKQLAALPELMNTWSDMTGSALCSCERPDYGLCRRRNTFQFDKDGMFMERVDEVVRRGGLGVRVG